MGAVRTQLEEKHSLTTFMIIIHCPNCGAKIEIEEKIPWNTAFCRSCKTDLIVHLTRDHIYVKYDPAKTQRQINLAT